MSLISFSNVTKYYSTELILDHISFEINKGERVALIGSNGNGKTTIFKLILKEEEPTLVAKEDKVGDISVLNGTKIGYLNQNAITNINNTVKEELMLSFSKILAKLDYFNEFTKKLEYDRREETLLKYNELLDELNEINAFNLDYKIDEYLSRFNFPLALKDKRISSLSGGERMKIAFIKILLGNYDVLLLDEPTNHLDISTIEWLENFLKNYNGTLFFISHDRYFLEALSTKIIDLENHKTTVYNVGYDTYLEQKELMYQQHLAQFQKEEEEMARLRKFIEFYMPKPRFVGRAKDRVHKFARLQENHVNAPVKENKEIKFRIDGGNLKNKGLLEINNLEVGYNGKSLLPPINLTIYGKDRIAIVGDNGIGKTTFIKTILNNIESISGSYRHLRELKIGYIKQNDYFFDSSLDCLGYLGTKHPKLTERELRTALGRFLFRKEDVFKNCALLSNGEKMRLVLCDLTLNEYDLLILDEPTNHLDMVTKECLLESLKGYNGAIIFISHDRYFINSLADYVLYLSKDLVLLNEGSYDDLKEKLSSIESKNNEDLQGFQEKTVIKEPTKKVQKSGLSNNKIKAIEERISLIENEIATLEQVINDSNSTYIEINEAQEKKDKLEEEYLVLLEQLEGN